MKVLATVFAYLVIDFLVITSFVFPNSIILINGATCAGKSTTAQNLATILRDEDMRVTIVSIDDYMHDIMGYSNDPQLHLRMDQYQDFETKSPFYALSAHGVAKLCDVFNQGVISFAEDQLNDFIIVEHCFSYETMFCDTLLRFKSFNVFFIKLYCTYEEASKRLKHRNSTPGDSNRSEWLVDAHFCKIEHFPGLKTAPKPLDFHANKVYDLEINTTEETPEQCALKIKNVLDTKPPTAFQSNYLNKYWIEKIQSLYSEEIIQQLKN
jgi:chloramphenicol 3-O-phosphotransferase